MELAYQGSTAPAFDRVLYPTDESVTGEPAFAHAMRIALAAGAELTTFHLCNPVAVEGAEFPGVRTLLERWGKLPPGSERRDVAGTGMQVKKIVGRDAEPGVAIMQHLEQHPAGLVVLTTHGHKGLPQWFCSEEGRPLASTATTTTLYIPEGCEGFVDRNNGEVSLQRVVIPVDHHPNAQPAVDAAIQLAWMLDCKQVEFVLVHVGDDMRKPKLHLKSEQRWTWTWAVTEGDVLSGVLGAVQHYAADLVVLATAGREGVFDAMRGSTSERIVRAVACPVLSVPQN